MGQISESIGSLLKLLEVEGVDTGSSPLVPFLGIVVNSGLFLVEGEVEAFHVIT